LSPTLQVYTVRVHKAFPRGGLARFNLLALEQTQGADLVSSLAVNATPKKKKKKKKIQS
jgi:hypothetical protein